MTPHVSRDRQSASLPLCDGNVTRLPEGHRPPGAWFQTVFHGMAAERARQRPAEWRCKATIQKFGPRTNIEEPRKTRGTTVSWCPPFQARIPPGILRLAFIVLNCYFFLLSSVKHNSKSRFIQSQSRCHCLSAYVGISAHGSKPEYLQRHTTCRPSQVPRSQESQARPDCVGAAQHSDKICQ